MNCAYIMFEAVWNNSQLNFMGNLAEMPSLQ